MISIKNILKIIIVLITTTLLYGCSNQKIIKTESSSMFIDELTELKYINEVKLYFLRPSVYCEISVNDNFTEEEINKLIAITEDFVTIDNMKEISKKNWHKEASMPNEFTFKIYRGKKIRNDSNPDYYFYSLYSDPLQRDILEYKIWSVFEHNYVNDKYKLIHTLNP